ncbi:hypothetical protein [Mycobacterium colombiense]|uniref:hypothetical protein n=1 Tax=Mycobacterium colombiense TaxID=339268 RepID=UPI00096E83A7|nr:hypothetical protein [Mycobacterium colombiense]OMC14882.1 hypothetical protein A5737_11805 [Mycobacterium colombiense]
MGQSGLAALTQTERRHWHAPAVYTWHSWRYRSTAAGHLNSATRQVRSATTWDLAAIPASPTEHRMGRRASTRGLTTASSTTGSFAAKHGWRRVRITASMRGFAEPLATEDRS